MSDRSGGEPKKKKKRGKSKWEAKEKCEREGDDRSALFQRHMYWMAMPMVILRGSTLTRSRAPRANARNARMPGGNAADSINLPNARTSRTAR